MINSLWMPTPEKCVGSTGLECDVTVTLFIPLLAARLSKVNTISECSDQNVQLRRLTRVFACRTRRFVKPIDCRRYIRLAKALIRLLMCRLRVCRLRVCRLIRLFVQVIGFTVHRPMRDLFLQTITLNILGKVFNRHFEYFYHSSKKTGFVFHANCLHCMKCQILFSW